MTHFKSDGLGETGGTSHVTGGTQGTPDALGRKEDTYNAKYDR